MIAEQLGENWKDEYVVWDNCCGGKNLTRDYRFKELYCSTLFESELQIGERYNKEATSFQFDFLNDDLSKLPQGLINAFEQNKPIVFFINPPYATATNRNETSKEGVAKTKINIEMLNNNIGGASQNLYAQFLYRIVMLKQEYNLTKCHIALFSPSLFLTGTAWKGFRKTFLDTFNYNDGILFKASHFADVSDSWGISFSLWNGYKSIDKENFAYKIVDIIGDSVQKINTKNIYNIDNKQSISEWAKEPIKKFKTHDVPNLSSGICVRNKENNRGKIFDNALGFINNGGNNVDQNTQMVALFTSAYGNGNGHGINKDNFTRCTALFACRRLIEKNWMNWQDEYLAPNENHEKFKEFVNDSVIYSLFENKSNQSSLRQVEYKGKKWDIKNEFFWMSKNDIINLANQYGLDEVYQDACTSNERYVYNYIQEHKNEFSKEALDVLNKAIDLTIKSFKYRQLFAEEHPEYHLDKAWDCGYYQLKAIWKEYMKEEFEEFKQLYKALSDKMQPMVYELGFLK
jgi:hypothetical protein